MDCKIGAPEFAEKCVFDDVAERISDKVAATDVRC